ncbi:MAG: hypothetical protein GQ564_16325 [Bacteroidales bacterium]|nr:hypothetical protein [Bacteroidales bacterium]
METRGIEVKKMVKQPSENSFLYRYVTIDKLFDTLIHGRFPLTRLNLFEDKLEGITKNHLLVNLVSDKLGEMVAPWFGEVANIATININPQNRNSLRRQRIDFQNNNFANCWFVSDHESIAMWQLYSRPDSIAIKIPYKSLIEQIDLNKFQLSGYNHLNLRYGAVDYFKFDDVESLTDLMIQENHQGFVKDKSFSHENEFRIMLSIKNQDNKKAEKKDIILDEQIENYNKNRDVKIIYLTFDNFRDMPFELIFHPLSNNWHQSNVKDIIQKYDLTFQVNESSLKRILH